MWYPSLMNRNSSRARQPMSRENVTGLLRRLQDFFSQIKIENIYLFKIFKKNMKTSLKPGFAQIFSCCPKNPSCPKFGGLQPPSSPRPVRLCRREKMSFMREIDVFSPLAWDSRVPRVGRYTTKCIAKVKDHWGSSVTSANAWCLP